MESVEWYVGAQDFPFEGLVGVIFCLLFFYRTQLTVRRIFLLSSVTWLLSLLAISYELVNQCTSFPLCAGL